MNLSNIIPTVVEEEVLDLNGFFGKPKVGKANVSTFYDEKVDSGDDFESPIIRKPKKDRKSTRLNSSHSGESRMPSSA